MKDTQKESLLNYLRTDIKAALSNYGNIGELHDPNEVELIEELGQNLMVAIIGFEADGFNGSMLLALSPSHLEASMPTLSQKKDSFTEAELGDWGGELSNLILARFKAHLLDFGLTLGTHPPSVSFGLPSIIQSHGEHTPSARLWFKQDGYPILLQIAGHMDEGIDFHATALKREEGPRPGDVVVTLNPTTKRYVPTTPAELSEGGSRGKVVPLKSPAESSPLAAGNSTALNLEGLNRDSRGWLILKLAQGPELRIDPKIWSEKAASPLVINGSPIICVIKGNLMHLELGGLEISLEINSAA